MILTHVYYHNTVRQWLLAMAIGLAIFVFLLFFKSLLMRHIGRRETQSATEWGGLGMVLSKRIYIWVPLVLAVYTASLFLKLPDNAATLTTRTVLVVLLIQAGLLGSHAISFTMDRYRRRKISSNAAAVTTLNAVGFVMQTVLWTIFLVIILDLLGINVTAFIAGLGIGGVAVALAVQNILGDLFASFSIVFDKPFVIGDFIIVGEFMGTVEHVGLKTTRIRSLSGEQLIFSNGDLLGSRIRNFKRMHERRVVFSFGVLYQTPHELLEQIPTIIKNIIDNEEPVRFDRAHFKLYGAYSLEFEVVYWIQNPDYTMYMDIQQAINLSIFRQFTESGIQFAYPTQTLFLKNTQGSSQ